jgi:hypothetical protein
MSNRSIFKAAIGHNTDMDLAMIADAAPIHRIHIGTLPELQQFLIFVDILNQPFDFIIFFGQNEEFTRH